MVSEGVIRVTRNKIGFLTVILIFMCD